MLSGTEGVRDAKEALEACFAAQGPTPATRAGLPALKAQKEAVGWLKGLAATNVTPQCLRETLARYRKPMDTSLAHREKPLRSRTKEREVTGRPGHATHRAGALTEVQSGLCDEMGIDGRRLENQSQTVLRCNPASVTTLGGVWIHAYTADRPPLRPTPPPRQHRIHTGWRATHAMGMMMGQPSKLAWNRRTSCVMPESASAA